MGVHVQADRAVLFAMPLLQVGLLVFFMLVATFHFMYSWWLLIFCLCTGGVSTLFPGREKCDDDHKCRLDLLCNA